MSAGEGNGNSSIIAETLGSPGGSASAAADTIAHPEYGFNKDRKAKTALRAVLRMTKSFAKSPITREADDDDLEGIVSLEHVDSDVGLLGRKRSILSAAPAGPAAGAEPLGTLPDVERVEAQLRVRKQDSFFSRVLKLRLTALSGYMQLLHFQNLTRKRLSLVVDYEPHERLFVVHSESRARIVFEVYIALAKELDAARHELIDAELIVLSHFNAINSHCGGQWALEENEMVEREEIEHECWGWAMWHLSEAASLDKQALFQATVFTMETKLVRMALDSVELRARINIQASEAVRRVLWASHLMVDSKRDCGVIGLLLADKALRQHHLTQVAPLLRLRAALVGHRARRSVFALLVEDWPFRRRLRAAATLHRICKGFFVRKFCRVYHEHCFRAELAAARTIQRCARGYLNGRWWLACFDWRRRMRAREQVERQIAAVLEAQERRRDDIVGEEDACASRISRALQSELANVAVGVIGRVTSGFVTRFDLALWRKFGKDPIEQASGRGPRLMAELSRACDWHNMAASHQLWDGDVCDSHIF